MSIRAARRPCSLGRLKTCRFVTSVHRCEHLAATYVESAYIDTLHLFTSAAGAALSRRSVHEGSGTKRRKELIRTNYPQELVLPGQYRGLLTVKAQRPRTSFSDMGATSSKRHDEDKFLE
jgi:hypothetical protein